MNACVVAEYYPRRRDPVLGIWAHRQAVATRDAGADVKVLVLERPVPPASSLRRPWRLPGALRGIARQPRDDVIDGIAVHYVRFTAGSRESNYPRWHENAARPLGKALARLRSEWPFDVIHAHYALPAGGAALPFVQEHGIPLLVSVHGGDLLGPLLQTDDARATVASVLGAAGEVLCNSSATLQSVFELIGSDERLRVLHLGASAPAERIEKHPQPTVATLGHLIPRKRHADVLEAIASLPDFRWHVIGDGPERQRLEKLASERGVSDRTWFAGQLAPDDALRELAACHVMALPSVDEALGVAYIEALACGVPAIGSRGQAGPEDIAAAGPGMLLVPPGDPAALADAIRSAFADAELPDLARRTAQERFSWQRCGRETVAAYRDALAG